MGKIFHVDRQLPGHDFAFYKLSQSAPASISDSSRYAIDAGLVIPGRYSRIVLCSGA
jgi:hypothetical protein